MSISNFKADDGGFSRLPFSSLKKYDSLGNRERLDKKLDILLSNCSAIQYECEKQLSDMALTVGGFDGRLEESHSIEWPDETLGDPGETISFAYYKAMRLRNTTSASYIRKRYEEAARDMTGSKAMDILILADITKREALLIEEFLHKKGEYIGSTAEQKILENLEIWVQAAAVQTKKLYEYLIRPEEPDTDYEESLGAAAKSPSQARRVQAVLKVSLNGLNDTIEQSLDALKRNFSAYAQSFYFDHLAPAVEADDAAGSRFDSGTAETIHSQLESSIEDQKRRSKIYRDQFDRIIESMKERDSARAKILVLTKQGKSLPASGPAVMRKEAIAAEEIDFWRDSDTGTEGTITSLIADHSKLQNLDRNSHPQYLLKGGDTITGDILLDAEATIDGMVPSKHAHTGTDGTSKIDGRNIIEGTLSDNVVDDSRPAAPTDLRVDSFNQSVVPPGVTAIDTVLAWDGDERYTHEVQLRRVS